MAALVWYVVSSIHVISGASYALFSPHYDGRESLARMQKVTQAQSWMITLSLAVNVSTDLS